MAKFNPERLRAEMLASVQSIEGYLNRVKKDIRTANSRGVASWCNAINIEISTIERKNVQLAGI